MLSLKPENALQRTEELLAVGRVNDALEQLHTTLQAKKSRTWQKPLELIMLKFIDLCVSTNNPKRAKDGLHQFRLISQQVPSSLEVVVNHFLDLSEAAITTAQSQSNAATSDADSYEALLISSVNGTSAKERIDAQVLEPAYRFLGEAYRSVLDISKSNAALEPMYHNVVRRAIRFYKTNGRKNELRRINEILRAHAEALQQPITYTPTLPMVNLSHPETQHQQMLTRFELLGLTIEFGQWSEAFKTLDDIHKLMQIAVKKPKPQLLAMFYERLAQVLLVSNNHLYHAYAYYRFYSTSRMFNKALTAHDIATMASKLLLATLAIPPSDDDQVEMETSGASSADALDADDPTSGAMAFDAQKAKNARLAELVGLPGASALRRSTLLSELFAKNVLSDALPEAAAVYNAFNDNKNPLTFCANVRKSLDVLCSKVPALNVYRNSLDQLSIVRLLQQLSQLYDVLRIVDFERLMARPAVATTTTTTTLSTFGEIEPRVADAVRRGQLELRIDHRDGVLRFGPRSLESSSLRYQLRDLCANVQAAARLIQPAQSAGERRAARQRQLAQFLAGVDDEHAALLARKVTIEKQKEQDERERLEAEQKAQDRETKLRTESEQATATSIAADLAKRQANKKADEARDRAIRESTNWSATVVGGEDVQILPSLENESTEKMRKLIEARNAMIARISSDMERLNYLERARRAEEIPMLKEAWSARLMEDNIYARDLAIAALDLRRAQHEALVAAKDRLMRAKPQADALKQRLQQRARDARLQAEQAHAQRVAERRKQLRQAARQRHEAEQARQAKLQREREEKERAEQEAAAMREAARRDAQEAADRERRDREKQQGPSKYQPPGARRVDDRDRGRDDDRFRDRDRDRDRPSGSGGFGSGGGGGDAWRRGGDDRDRRPVGGSSSGFGGGGGGSFDRDRRPDDRDRGGFDRDRRPDDRYNAPQRRDDDRYNAPRRDDRGFGPSRDGPPSRDGDRFGPSRDGPSRDGDRFGPSRDGPSRDGPRDGPRDGDRFGPSRDGPRDGDRYRDSRDAPRDNRDSRDTPPRRPADDKSTPARTNEVDDEGFKTVGPRR